VKLRKYVSNADLHAAINRMRLHGLAVELEHLSSDQLRIYAAAIDAPPDHPIHQQVAALIRQREPQ
jgi:hypothetical protein